MGSSNGKIGNEVADLPSDEEEQQHSASTTPMGSPTSVMVGPNRQRRTTITTFDKELNRVSIVSIRYLNSPIGNGEDKSVLSIENYSSAMARVFTFLDIVSLIMCSR